PLKSRVSKPAAHIFAPQRVEVSHPSDCPGQRVCSRVAWSTSIWGFNTEIWGFNTEPVGGPPGTTQDLTPILSADWRTYISQPREGERHCAQEQKQGVGNAGQKQKLSAIRQGAVHERASARLFSR